MEQTVMTAQDRALQLRAAIGKLRSFVEELRRETGLALTVIATCERVPMDVLRKIEPHEVELRSLPDGRLRVSAYCTDFTGPVSFRVSSRDVPDPRCQGALDWRDLQDEAPDEETRRAFDARERAVQESAEAAS